MLPRSVRLLAAAAASLLGAPDVQAQSTLPAAGALSVDPAFQEKVLRSVRVPDGFHATVFAGPPHAMYPTCLADSPDGALFVCVDPNLSLSQDKGRGRVMRLVDEDGDGDADRYTVFAQLDSPRGLASDGRTLYVMHPPSLSALRDTDGDGVADQREVLVEGIGFDLDFRGADHTTNGVTLGIDGWLYIAVGDYGFRRAVGRDGRQLQHRGGGVARVRTDGTGLEMYTVGTRNIYDVAVSPLLHVFARDNTNDGDGWNTRLHYLPAGADMGYPSLYRNFADEHFPSLADYGAGAGTGALWVHDPAFPEGFGNTLYTADWTLSKIFRHPLRPRGGSYAAEQEEFLALPRPADLAVDGRSNLYVASLAGGQFNYSGDTVGYVLRLRPAGAAGAAALAPASASDAALLEALGSANAQHRLYAQREILRRGGPAATAQRLEQMALDARRPAYARVAALFTLKQLTGARSHPTLLRAAADASPQVRALALRALADRKDQLAGVPDAPFLKALSDADAGVRVQAIQGLARLGARHAADALLPLAAGSDSAVAHLATSALVELRASQAALRALDTGAPATRAAALRVLQRIHDEPTVAALLDRLGRAQGEAQRRPLLSALARLYNREGIWAGDWWGTKPSYLGPYFDPAAWEGSARIRPALREALLGASGERFATLADDLARNRVLPPGSTPLLVALTAARDPRRTEVVDALVGRQRIGAELLPVLAALDTAGPAMHAAVVRLLGEQRETPAGAVPLLRRAVADTGLDGELRGQALSVLGRLPGPEGLEVATEAFARTIPGDDADPELERVWRRFVGDRRNLQLVDHFIELTRAADPQKRTLGYAVLVQINRGRGGPEQVQQLRARAARAVDAAWTDPAAAPLLVRAITVMRAEDDYAERLKEYGGN